MDAAALAELLSSGSDRMQVCAADLAAATFHRKQNRSGISDHADLVRRLCIASERGHVDVVRLLLLLAPDAVDGHNTRGLTPLLLACTYGHDAVAQLLLESQAQPNTASSDATQRAPLHAACKRGDSRLVALLLGARAHTSSQMRHQGSSSLLSQAPYTLTPMQVACMHRHAAVVSLLVSGAERGRGSQQDEHDRPAYSASTWRDNHAMLDTNELERALHCAAHAGDTASVKILLSNDAERPPAERVLDCDCEDILVAHRVLECGAVALRGPPLLSSLAHCFGQSATRASATTSRSRKPIPPSAMTRYLSTASVLLDAGASTEAQCSIAWITGGEDAHGLPRGQKHAVQMPADSRHSLQRISVLDLCCMAGAREAVCLLLSHARCHMFAAGTRLVGISAAETAAKYGHRELAQLVHELLQERADEAMRTLLAEEEAERDAIRSVATGRRRQPKKGRTGQHARAWTRSLPSDSSALSPSSTAHGGEGGASQSLINTHSEAAPASKSASRPLLTAYSVGGGTSCDAMPRIGDPRQALIERAKQRSLGSKAGGLVHGQDPGSVVQTRATRTSQCTLSARNTDQPLTSSVVQEGGMSVGPRENASQAIDLMTLSEFWKCPLTHHVMRDPVVAADGYTYERCAAERWLSERLTSPTTGEPLSSKILTPNTTLRLQIAHFASCQEEQPVQPCAEQA